MASAGKKIIPPQGGSGTAPSSRQPSHPEREAWVREAALRLLIAKVETQDPWDVANCEAKAIATANKLWDLSHGKTA